MEYNVKLSSKIRLGFLEHFFKDNNPKKEYHCLNTDVVMFRTERPNEVVLRVNRNADLKIHVVDQDGEVLALVKTGGLRE